MDSITTDFNAELADALRKSTEYAKSGERKRTICAAVDIVVKHVKDVEVLRQICAELFKLDDLNHE